MVASTCRLGQCARKAPAVSAAPSALTAPILKIGPASVFTATPPPVRSPFPPAPQESDEEPTPEERAEGIPIHVHAGPKPTLMLHAAPPDEQQGTQD